MNDTKYSYPIRRELWVSSIDIDWRVLTIKRIEFLLCIYTLNFYIYIEMRLEMRNDSSTSANRHNRKCLRKSKNDKSVSATKWNLSYRCKYKFRIIIVYQKWNQAEIWSNKRSIYVIPSINISSIKYQ